jgi:hypothetical protein
MDGAAVIGAVLEGRARGVSCRRLALLAGRPLSTVRGWVGSAVVASRVAPGVFGVVVERWGVDPGGAWSAAAPGAAGFVEACCFLAAGLGVAPVWWLVVASVVTGARVLQASFWEGGVPHESALPGVPLGLAGWWRGS